MSTWKILQTLSTRTYSFIKTNMAGTFSNLANGNMIATPNANTTLGQYQAAQNAGWSPAQTPGGAMTGANTGTNNGTSNGTMYGTAQQGLTNYGTGSGNSNVNTAIGNSQQVANNQGTYAPQIQSAIGTLGNISQNQTPQVNQAYNNLSEFSKSNPLLQAGFMNNPNLTADVATGRGQILGNQLSGEQNALGNIYSSALQGQSQQIGAAQDTSQQGQAAQGQQLGAANQVGNLAQSQQSQQLGALSVVSAPVAGPGGVLYNPQSVNNSYPGGAGAAFTGGQAGAEVSAGTSYQNNIAPLNALTGTDDGTGSGGMTGDFLNSLQSAGLNAGTVNIGTALTQGLSANTSGPYASQQTAFQNIMSQYGKILGAQTVNGLLQSSSGQTIAQFLQTLSNQAQQVQKGYQAAGGQNSGNQSTNTTSASQSSDTSSLYNF